jgi:hypothetical protein
MAFVAGAICFAIGFIGPVYWMPEANRTKLTKLAVFLGVLAQVAESQ